jgi:hypothetical protein
MPAGEPAGIFFELSTVRTVQGSRLVFDFVLTFLRFPLICLTDCSPGVIFL